MTKRAKAKKVMTKAAKTMTGSKVKAARAAATQPKARTKVKIKK